MDIYGKVYDLILVSIEESTKKRSLYPFVLYICKRVLSLNVKLTNRI